MNKGHDSAVLHKSTTFLIIYFLPQELSQPALEPEDAAPPSWPFYAAMQDALLNMPPSVLPMATDMEEDGVGGGLAGAFQEEYEEEDDEDEEEEDEEEDDDEGMLDEDDGEGFDDEEDSQDMEVKHQDDISQEGNYETEIDEICECYMNFLFVSGSLFLPIAAFRLLRMSHCWEVFHFSLNDRMRFWIIDLDREKVMFIRK